MLHEVIVVGGGPAGAACAGELVRQGIDCLVIDKQPFPRPKLCAGWTSPSLWKALAILPQEYPHTLIEMNRLLIHLGPLTIPLCGKQHGVRRIEFDAWLLQRSQAKVATHLVRKIEKKDDTFVIDEHYRCRYLVGAGGTRCPVYNQFFAAHFPRFSQELILTLEAEIDQPVHESNCHLRFAAKGLPGYAWYVPKGPQVLNVGIGALQQQLQRRSLHLRRAWDNWQNELLRRKWLDHPIDHPGSAFYYRRHGRPTMQQGRAYVIGDSAALATRDMGEGILPAVQSGLLAARSIADGQPVDITSLPLYSRIFPTWLSTIFTSNIPAKHSALSKRNKYRLSFPSSPLNRSLSS
ncbi:MAG TPA: NAD(P)/FAD-dependent oxidoreductase [bacterium]|nr:NAD(P)/FAD-dependent oxidoreductase [bacterium]HPG46235.1 NAD(P)/FAD-dependent oxidoreductase [bacterium]HPM98571.1 NAD(P)/FAD-dependent oxidoreductase [bacterium]